MLTLLGLSRASYTPLVSLSFRLCQPMCVWSADLDVNLRLHSCRLPRYVRCHTGSEGRSSSSSSSTQNRRRGEGHSSRA
jgi:hypothetical protein